MRRPYLTIGDTMLGCLTLALAILLGALPGGARGQRAPYAFPPRSSPYAYPSNVRITYGGNIIMDLGNYDVVFGPRLQTGPGSAELWPSEGGYAAMNSPQIIYKGDTGLRWDGGNFFYNPAAYPRHLVDQYHYRNRVVGRGEEQYPPLPQDERKVQRGRLAVGEEQPSARLPFGRITPAPLPGLAEDLPDICRDYPYAIQCRPRSQQLDPERMPLPPPGETIEPLEPRPAITPRAAPSQPLMPLPGPSAKPIIILNRAENADACTYELLSPQGNFSHTLSPGQQHVVRVERDWQIRFDSDGMGVKTYQLHSGQTYRFSRNQSDVWELQRLRRPRATPKAKVEPNGSP